MAWDKQHVQSMIGMMGYAPGTGKNEHVWKQTVDGKVYGVDFREEEVFMFIGMDRLTDVDDDTFRELQNAVEYANASKEEGQESAVNNPSTTEEIPETPANVPSESEHNKPVETPKPESEPTKPSLLSLIKDYVDEDVLEVFGDTGTGKSRFALTVAKEAIAAGKKVYYLDTERNLTKADIASLKGCEYKYTPVIEEIDQLVRKLPAVDVVIIDSIGFPVLTSYARLSMKQKGDALLKLIAIFGDLKKWAYLNNGVAIVTNQPESEFNKEPGHVLRPFGDKSQFAAKEIWKTEIIRRDEKLTDIIIKSFRSRSVGHGAKIAGMKITGNGVEVV